MKSKQIVSLLLCMIILTSVLASCKSTASEKVLLKSSDQLVIYRNPLFGTQMDKAVLLFQEEYPDVNVEYRDFGDDFGDGITGNGDYDQFVSILQSELNAGKGPDIIVGLLSDISPDFTKAANSNIFLDLTNALEEDTDLKKEDYISGTFSAGMVGGKNLYVPLEVNPPLLLFSDKRTLEKRGINMENLSDIQGLSEEISKLTLAEDESLWDISGGGYDRYFLIPFTLRNPVDYENHKVNIDESFQSVMQLSKQLYQEEQRTTYDKFSGPVYLGLSGYYTSIDSLVFSVAVGAPQSICEFRCIDPEHRVMMHFPTEREKPVMTAQTAATIRSTSENTENAFNFLKIMLSDSVQSAFYSIPVKLLAYEKMLDDNVLHTSCSDLSGNEISNPLTDEERKQFVEMRTQNFQWDLPLPSSVFDIINETMTPYFEDKKSYQDCADELYNRLTLYLDE